MINWKPDREANESLHNQIFRYFLNNISKGAWPIGTRLPTERALAKLFEVNRSTVSSVMDELKSEGLIESRGSAGTYVANNTWSILMSNPPPNWDQYIKYSIHKPNQQIIQAINTYEFEAGIIRLGTGELSPDLFPKDMMDEVMMKVSARMTAMNYEEPKGLYALRCSVAKYLKRYGLDLEPDQILIVSGSLQALQLISMGLLQAGSNIYVERPSYLKSLHIFQSAGMRLKGLEMDGEGVSLSSLTGMVKSTGTNLLYTIPTFQNPTGTVMPQSRREDLVKLVNDYRLPVIEDDAYRELWLDEEPPMPMKALDRSGNILYLGSLSKSLFPGIRIGWLAGPKPVVERLGDIKMQTDYGSSSVSQLIADEWFRSGRYEIYTEELRGILRQKRDFTMALLERYFDDLAQWEKPAGGFYVWLKFNEKIDLNKLFYLALEENLLLNPGHIYDFEHNNAIRLSYAYASCEELEQGLCKLAGIVEGMIR